MAEEERPLPEGEGFREEEEAAAETSRGMPFPAAPAAPPMLSPAPARSRDLFGGLLALFGGPGSLPERGLLPKWRRRKKRWDERR